MKYNIGCVIVTYNRKELLRLCLEAVASQTVKPHTVYITDNASTDGTCESVKEWGYYNSIKNGIEYKYILNDKNEGGAGGFCLGMKSAFYDDSYDGIWVMDDDGIPYPDCLERLLHHLNEYHFLSPVVVAKENHKMMAFRNCSVDEYVSKANNGIILDNCPFNGILFSTELIKKIGFPKKELFIWGDEDNYRHRAIEAGHPGVTVADAFHIHPQNRQEEAETICHKIIKVTDVKWKLFCMMRNNAYNNTVRKINWIKRVGIPIRVWFYYTYYFVVKRKNFSIVLLLTEAFLRGLFHNFGGMKKYMK